MKFLGLRKVVVCILILMQTAEPTECHNPYLGIYGNYPQSVGGGANYHYIQNLQETGGPNFGQGTNAQTTNRPKRSFGLLEGLLGGGGYTAGGYYPNYSRGYGLGGLLAPLYNKLAYSNPYFSSRYRYYGPGVYSSLFAGRGYGFH